MSRLIKKDAWPFKNKRNTVSFLDDNFLGYVKSSNRTSEIPNDQLSEEKNFHQILYPVLLMAQCFGLMPVYGIKETNVKNLAFHSISWKVFYSLAIMLAIVTNITMTIIWYFHQNADLTSRVALAFYFTNLFCVIIFNRLAKNWPELMRYWVEVEESFPKYLIEKKRLELDKRIRRFVWVIMSMAFVQQLLSYISGLYPLLKCDIIEHPFEVFVKLHYPQMFYFLSYNLVTVILGPVLNIFCVFHWTFFDLFIILVSVTLSTRLNQMNESLRSGIGKIVKPSFWDAHRVHYQKFTELLSAVDSSITSIILLSYALNLFFICIQLLNSLTTFSTGIQAVYYWGTLIYQITRTVTVSLCASKIHDESQKSLLVFRQIPQDGWCEEAQRFFEQVLNDKVALSGKKFFHLTRKLILTIAGTIVTYELVLIQFKSGDDVIRDEFC